MTPQARSDTLTLLVDLAVLVLIGVLGGATYESAWVRKELVETQAELRFTSEFMLNCLNGKTQVVGNVVAVKCFVF